jgi:hypothetical protein
MHRNETDPTVMAGDGSYQNVSVRGIGFAPKKRVHLVLPPDVRNQEDLAEFLKTQTVKQVADVALEALIDTQ